MNRCHQAIRKKKKKMSHDYYGMNRNVKMNYNIRYHNNIYLMYYIVLCILMHNIHLKANTRS